VHRIILNFIFVLV